MVIVYITGYTGFEVALRKMAEANKIDWPRMPVVLEHAFEQKDLGIAIGMAAAIASTLWQDAPPDYLKEIARELGWREVDLHNLLRKVLNKDRYDKVTSGELTAADLGFTDDECWMFFRRAGMHYTVVDSLNPRNVGTVKQLGAGQDNPQQPPGVVLRTMETFGTQMFNRAITY